MKNRKDLFLKASRLSRQNQKTIFGGLLPPTNCDIYDFYCSITRRCYATLSQCQSICGPTRQCSA